MCRSIFENVYTKPIEKRHLHGTVRIKYHVRADFSFAFVIVFDCCLFELLNIDGRVVMLVYCPYPLSYLLSPSFTCKPSTMKLKLSLGALLFLILCAVKQDPVNAAETKTLCELWANKTYDYDLITVTDDFNYGAARDEDMAMIDAFRKLGRKATRISIEDYDFDWSTTKITMIRSAWNKYEYLEHYHQFQRDMDEISILMNPLKVIQWQSNKEVYLKELRDAGVNVPKTIMYSSKDGEIEIGTIQERLGCDDILVKPAKGNAGRLVARLFDDEDDFVEACNTIFSYDETALFQCFQARIMETGERGIVFLGGEVNYGLLKMPEQGDFMVNELFGGHWSFIEPTEEEVAFAKNVAAKVHELSGAMPAYLRVDVIDDNDGNLALMELAAGTANFWMKHRPELADPLARYLDEYLLEIEKECETMQNSSEGSSIDVDNSNDEEKTAPIVDGHSSMSEL